MKKLTLILFTLLTVLHLSAADFTVASGTFTNPAIWNSGSVPAFTEDITISTGHDVTMDGYGSAIDFDGSLVIQITASLTINDNPTNLDLNGTSDIYGTLNVTNGNMLHYHFVGTHTIHPSATVICSNELRVEDDAILNSYGTVSVASHVNQWQAGTASTIDVRGGSFNVGGNWDVYGDDAKTIVSGGAVTVTGDWILSGVRSTTVINGGSTTIGNDWILSGDDSRADVDGGTFDVIGGLVHSGSDSRLSVGGGAATVGADWILSGVRAYGTVSLGSLDIIGMVELMGDDTRSNFSGGSTTIGTDWILSGVRAISTTSSSTTIGNDWILSGSDSRANVSGGSTVIGNDWILSGSDSRANIVNGSTTIGNDWILSGSDSRAYVSGSATSMSIGRFLDLDNRSILFITDVCIDVAESFIIRNSNVYVDGIGNININISAVTPVQLLGGSTEANVSDLVIVFNNTAGGCGFICATCDTLILGTRVTLPIILKSFSVYNNNCDNIVEWTTSSEINVSHFIIERSGNGHQYIKVDVVSAEGLESLGATYKFVDNTSTAAYYRITVVDRDGAISYTPVVFAKGCYGSDSYIEVYPTLVKDNLNIYFNSPEQVGAELIVVDMVGREVYRKNINVMSGSNHFRLELYLPPNTYFVKIMAGDYMSTKRFFISQ